MRMKKQFYFIGRLCLLSFLALLISTLTFSQNRPISGKVTDAKDGTPLPGVSVQVKGQNTGATTDMNGSFSISVVPGTTLTFTHTGYEGFQVKVGEQETLNVQLQLSKGSMSEVVVIGYGTARKKDLTGSVGSVKASQLQERPAASLNEALSGRIAGVQVNTNSGRPGGQTTVRIRGFSSINSSNNPLYVVDGVYIPIGNQTLNSNSIDYINPNDIASVEVLKDASGTAIYGARGANGVVLITTKRGTNGPARVTYDGNYSVPTIGPKRVHMLNAQQYLDLEDLAYDNIKVYDPDGWAAGNYSQAIDPRVKRKSLPNMFDANGKPLYNTDWVKESEQHKLSQNHQIGVTGGSDNNLYGLFLNYRDDNGLLLNSYLKRYAARFVLDLKPKEWLRMGGSISYNNQEENLVDQGTGGLNSVRMITESFPFLPVKFADGTWGDNYLYPGAEGGSNPVHILTDRKFILNTQSMLGNSYVNLILGNGFDIKSQVGVSLIQRQESQFSGRGLSNISMDQNGTASIFDNREIYWSSETFLNYNKSFHGGDHTVSGLVGLSWQGTNYTSVNASAQNFSTDFFQYYNLGQGSVQNASTSNKSNFAFNSYFGRLNYGYKQKYLLTVTGRIDGSSKFGDNHKYAFFPSAGVAWNASNEDFLKSNKTISHLKFRVSTGLTGNSEIAPYSSDALLGSYTGIFNNARFSGVGTSRLGNPDLKWEKTAQTDAGIELGLFDNRINLEFDAYYRKTSDMLLDAPLPRSTGYASYFRNVGSMENKGIEIGLKTVNIKTQDFSWNTTFNISFNRNKVLSLATPAPIFSGNPNFLSNTGIIQVGKPVGSFWGLIREGVWTESERAEAAKFASYRGGKPILPGDLKYRDINGDYAINDLDRVIIGNGNPKGWGAFSNDFSYKNFDLLVELSFMYGNDMLNQTHHSGEDRTGISNSFSSVLDYYQPGKNDHNTMIATIRDTRAGYVTNVDTRWIEDGSFLRGKNLLLGYNVPAKVFERWKLSKLRVSASVQNFFLKTKFSGNDPEVTTYNNAFAQGQTFFDYPKPTTYMLSINVGL
jgi:TonB-dependent starch-binding outer membrane protein SusC